MSGGRDDNGRFATGNPGGPGRPRRTTEAERLATLSERVTPEKWASIIDAAVGLAMQGDARSREWLSRFLLPVPSAVAGADLHFEAMSGSRTAEELRRDPDYLEWVRERAVAADTGYVGPRCVPRIVGRKD